MQRAPRSWSRPRARENQKCCMKPWETLTASPSGQEAIPMMYLKGIIPGAEEELFFPPKPVC